MANQNILIFVLLLFLDFAIDFAHQELKWKFLDCNRFISSLIDGGKVFAYVVVNFVILFIVLRSLVYIDIANTMRAFMGC